ncbi:hypothetical protein NQ318_019479 [Aromia moschata]|uniref:Uncharacterized protein n=1 Tax=Aromia moschata TaxID=1265417 RepID=A0AAV8XA13_9CUCU|nr:hypothetical protein NQ318_019479 [Aromia moschata]
MGGKGRAVERSLGVELTTGNIVDTMLRKEQNWKQTRVRHMNKTDAKEKDKTPEKRSSPSRVRRNLRRAMAWRKKKDESKAIHPTGKGPEKTEEAKNDPKGKDAPEEESPSTSKGKKTGEERPKDRWLKRFSIKWIKGTTLNAEKAEEGLAAPIQEEDTGRTGHEPTPGAVPDPKALNEAVEEAMRLSRLEEPATLTTALRHMTRLLHPGGKNISFPVPEAVDRTQLRCCNLPTDPHELKRLVERAFERREESISMENLYRDFVKSHGRVAMDPSKPWAQCYVHTRQP